MSYEPYKHVEQHAPPGQLGIGKGGLLFLLMAILCSIMQGSFVAAASPWGRVWPSESSAKVDLPPMNLTVPAQSK